MFSQGKDSRFDFDLRYGKVRERFLADLLQNQRVEVKSDRLAWKTGQAFVELYDAGKPSGLMVTRAPWWAFIVDTREGQPHHVVLVQTPYLWVLTDRWYRAKGLTQGGDGNKVQGVRVPLSALVHGS